MVTLYIKQVRQFMLLKHGLIDPYRFTGKQGILDFVRGASCIQFDPIDICGKNSELVCQSRIGGFTKTMLYELLYADRKLVDYLDKNVAITPVEDWPYFERFRQAARMQEVHYPQMQKLKEIVHSHIETNGAVCADDVYLEGDFYWRSAIHWSGGNHLSRSVMEQMYSTGELIIHHKRGTRKYYDLAERHIPGELLEAHDPLPDDWEHWKWRVLRRISAVGIMWNRASDAWINIWGLKSPQRNEIFNRLLMEEKIIEITVEGIRDKLYCLAGDRPLLETVLQDPVLKPRCELLAPLDSFLWDRRLIRALFHFDYTWEIYTPAVKRKYGHYVLPVLYGENLIGRIELAVDKSSRTLLVKNVWFEDGVKQTKKLKNAIDSCLTRFARFHECLSVSWDEGLKE